MRLFTPVLKYQFNHIGIGYLNIIIGFSDMAHNSILPWHILVPTVVLQTAAVIPIREPRARAHVNCLQYRVTSWVYTQNSIPFLGLTCIRKVEGKKAEGKKAGGTKEGIEKAYNHTYTLQKKGKLENICDGDVYISRDRSS